MKYTIHGFSQENAVKLGLDDRDLMLLRWFVDYKDTGKMIKKIVNNDMYYWIKYEGIQEAFPITNWKKDTIYRRLKKMSSLGILKHATVKQMGTYSYYALGENYIALTDTTGEIVVKYKTDASDINPKGTDTNPKVSDTNPEGTDLNPEHNINLLHSSINNSSINNIYSDFEETIKELYPGKKTKSIRDKKVPKLLKKYSIEELTRVLKRYNKECSDKDKQYILNESTFWNGRYEDYLDENYEDNKQYENKNSNSSRENKVTNLPTYEDVLLKFENGEALTSAEFKILSHPTENYSGNNRKRKV